MTYLFVGWISASIGFVLGAAWTGLCRKNKQYDKKGAQGLEELYSNAQQSNL